VSELSPSRLDRRCQHQARGADKTIIANIDAHVEAERRKPDNNDDTAGALVPVG
jgi:hypothetical protein